MTDCREVRRYGFVDGIGGFLWGVDKIGLPLEESCLGGCDNQKHSPCLSEMLHIPSWVVLMMGGLLGVAISYALAPKETVCPT